VSDRQDNKQDRKGKRTEVYSEVAEPKAPDLTADEMKTLALAYAKYLKDQNLSPGDATFVEPEDIGLPAFTEPTHEEPVKPVVILQDVVDGKPVAPVKHTEAAQPAEEAKPEEIPAEPAADTAAEAELDDADMKSVALAYARYLKEHNLNPGDATNIDPEDLGIGLKIMEPERAHVKILGDEEAAAAAETSTVAAAAAASEPVAPLPEATAAEAVSHAETAAVVPPAREPIEKAATADKTERSRKAGQQAKRKARAQAKAAKAQAKEEKKAARQALRKEKSKAGIRGNAGQSASSAPAEKSLYKMSGFGAALTSLLDAHDRAQDRGDERLERLGTGFAKEAHSIASTYRNSRRQIGIGLLVVVMLAAGILVIFDRFTVYEYAYNGKVLGYVKEQEEVTDVLEIAGDKLSQNNKGETGVEFVANQNVTFNLVDARGRSTDDADTAVNKFIYMTDIETGAFAVYDGDKVVAIVKDEAEAESLLKDTLEVLSQPDNGMTLESAEFTNELSIKPINVLLSSVQSSAEAGRIMAEGGNMETFHIVEEGETVTSLAKQFGVEDANIYNEDNSQVATEVEQGDKVCIRSSVEPVSVKMVETGRLKEVIEYETIKKESDEYYQGDTHLEQEGENGVQVFEGTLTKVAGEVTQRDEISTEVIRPKKDKIILVGTKERPKTAPTGTYMLPLQSYVVTSEFGGRWGRMHEGIDLGASTGTPIYAADGGKVIRATWYSGYGLCVDIDHENGRVTRYGHCSRLLVSAGDRVYQGQNIALVGNTGNSFGSHLHFEVRLDGTAYNPRKFLDF